MTFQISDAVCGMRFRRILLTLPVMASLGGCLSTLENGPERVITEDEQAQELRPLVELASLKDGYSEQQRNDFITWRMYAIDLKYNAYFGNLTKERQLGTLSADLALVGLGAATTVIPGAQTKAILGAATTALAGSKSAIDKDVLLEQTVQILQNQMEVSRAAIRKRILANMKNRLVYKSDPPQANENIYTLAQGLSDLEDYYRAGTLAGALEALSANVGDNAQQQRDLQNGVSPSGASVNADGKGKTDQGGPTLGFGSTRK